MKQGGVGVGSASVVLVFAVLCLTVFSLITLVVAGNDKALADSEAELSTGYYEADTLAEQILAEILESDSIPETIKGVDIESSWNMDLEADEAVYLCQISGDKSLYVRVALYGDSYSILSWRMIDTDEWTIDNSLHVWDGAAFFDDDPTIMLGQ